MFERRSPLRRWHRFAALVVAISCVAIFVSPIVRMTRAYVHRNGQFPVLADFHSRIELYWTLSVGVHREIVDDALEVEFGGEEFPGVAFHEPVPDWRRLQDPDHRRGKSRREPLRLVVRVHDRRHKHVQRSLQPQFHAGGGGTPYPANPARRHPQCASKAGSWIWRISRTSHCLRATSEGSLKLRIHSLRLE